ncbi:MAG TPA: bifunctional YncE family protein/alkaline phosphatase family protein [Chitinophagaceae bacterium]|nr:bifunctional YncE family protein/alkaline phosphatase family protein [Chitinophagaceae bacterium]
MKKIMLIFLPVFSLLISNAQNDTATPKVLTLSNGWKLSPAGTGLMLGDLPLNIAVSNSKKLMAVINSGQGTQSIQLIDVPKAEVIDNIVVTECWMGLKFSANGKFLYASGGNNNRILKYTVENRKLVLKDSIALGEKWPNKISPCGIDIDDAKNTMYVVTKEDNSLYTVNLKTKKVTGKYHLGGEAYTCLLSPDKKQLYISGWGSDHVYVFNTSEKKLVDSIPVGDNPNDICLTRNGKYLFVANANDNSVSVINTANKKVAETLTASLYPDAPAGSTTNGVALSPDEKTLYVANADNNCLAVFDVSDPGHSVSKGFIPTGWYPSCVKAVGDKIFVANGKGFSSYANPYGPNPASKKTRLDYQKGDTAKVRTVQYIGNLFTGTMSVINVPDARQLAAYSKQVYANTPYTKQRETISSGETGNPVPSRVGDPSPIKYVFYIIKENRTYDQVLGDIADGNGDTSLVLFGEKYTPNQHKIVNEFALLDNFYVDAEVSEDGHSWSTGAYATDYIEKNWPTNYGGRGGEYAGEGTLPVANNKVYIWDDCKQANVSYRTYGEFADDFKPNIPVLKDHLCPYFTGWNLRVRDTVRFDEWKREFDSLVKANALPHLSTLRFPNDHTEGVTKGRPTPFAHVADNDLAVGMFVDYLSKSPVWKESVVFILEDDAQDGPDHVDAHRSPVYIVSPYVKRHFTDHTFYSTSGVLRTIELILGLPPMSQYDAAATPLWRSFTAIPDLTPFNHVNENVDFSEKNTASSELSRKSATFNFSKEDEVNEAAFNEVLWKAIKGMNSKVPPPRRAAFVKVTNSKDDDD